jgi:DNA-binding PadR family transcriptional regulator
MSLRMALLGVLQIRPSSGYELSRFLHPSAGWVWSAPQSQIYPLLRRMEAEGAIKAELQVRGERLERRVYALTEQGHAELRRWAGSFHPSPTVHDPMALQTLFFDVVSIEETTQVLTEYASEQEERAGQFEQRRDRLLAHDTPLLRERLRSAPREEHDRIAQAKAQVFDGQARLARARAAWAREAIRIRG